MATKKEEKVVKVEPIKIKNAVITIVGKTPLIVNNFNEKSRRQILDAQMKVPKTKELRNKWEDFMRAFHWLTPMPEDFSEEGFEKALKDGARFGFPAKGIKSSIVSGAYRNGMVPDKVSLNGAFLIPEELVEIKYEEVIMREDYVRIARGGTDVRFRPEFRNWSMTFNIEYNENKYSIDQVINYMNLGGFSCGLGEMRIEKGDNFGSYSVSDSK